MVPSTRKRENGAGRTFYEIRVSRGRNKSPLSTRWYPPEGWSQKAIDRELAAVAADFERRCDAGEVVSRAEQNARVLQAAQEAAKVQTLRASMAKPCLCPRRPSPSARTAGPASRAILTIGYTLPLEI